jgi:hypothetical protein
MQPYRVLLFLIVLLLAIHEFIPAVHHKMRIALHGTQARVRELRAFIDDDSYNCMQEFSYCPFTMSDYLSGQAKVRWRDICRRARRRQRQGWGSPYWDGPDQLEPMRYWWRHGELMERCEIAQKQQNRHFQCLNGDDIDTGSASDSGDDDLTH